MASSLYHNLLYFQDEISKTYCNVGVKRTTNNKLEEKSRQVFHMESEHDPKICQKRKRNETESPGMQENVASMRKQKYNTISRTIVSCNNEQDHFTDIDFCGSSINKVCSASNSSNFPEGGKVNYECENPSSKPISYSGIDTVSPDRDKCLSEEELLYMYSSSNSSLFHEKSNLHSIKSDMGSVTELNIPTVENECDPDVCPSQCRHRDRTIPSSSFLKPVDFYSSLKKLVQGLKNSN